MQRDSKIDASTAEKSVTSDNENEILLKSEFIRSLDLQSKSIEFETLIRQHSKNREERVERALQNKEEGWKELENGLITFRERIYVPIHAKLREDIIRENHNSTFAGHPGRYKTAELVTHNYWWPRVQHDVREYVDGCKTCQRVKTHRTSPAAPLQPHDAPSQPWEIITLDLLRPLPMSNGYNAILVIIDRLTKYVKFEATHVELTAEGFAKILRDRVFRDHGLPQKIIHDRDPRFVNKYIQSLFALLGIRQNASTAFHPATDGQTERMNQDVEEYLRIFVNQRQDNWTEWLSIAKFCHNDREHSVTKQTPFFLNAGQHPWKGTEIRRTTNNKSANTFFDRMQHAREDARSALDHAAELMKRLYDQSRRPAIAHAKGDKVYLESTNISTERPSQKLEDRQYGPFPIKQKIGESAYELALPITWHGIHPVFNESLLTPFRPPKFPSQQKPPPPPPIQVQGDLRYEVDFIRDSQLRQGKVQYLVHWKGYPREEETWEPVSNITDAKAAVNDFHCAHPNAPCPTNTRQLKFVPITVDDSVPRHTTKQVFNWTKGKLPRKPSQLYSSAPVTDVILYIRPEHMTRIATQTKNHNYRKYELPHTVHRLWFFETNPVNTITFMATTGPAKKPGEVCDSSSIGNDDFDAGLKGYKFGYPIVQLYQFTDPLDRKTLKGKYGLVPPTSHFVPLPWLARDYTPEKLLLRLF